MTVMLCAFVTWTIVVEFVKGARTRQKSTGGSFFAAMYGLVMRNTRRYGGYVIHFGIVLLFVGFVGKAFTVHDKAVVREGEEFDIGRYSLRVEKLSKGENPNYLYDRAVLSVAKGDKFLGTMTPERRFFKASEQPTSVVAIRSLPHSFIEDFYVVFAARDERNGTAVFEAYFNPLVAWVWIGGIVTFLGTLLALVPNVAERRAAQQEQETKVLAEEEPVFARADST